MKRHHHERLWRVAIACGILFTLFSRVSRAAWPFAAPSSYVPGEILVKYRPGRIPRRVKRRMRDEPGAVRPVSGIEGLHLIRVPEGTEEAACRNVVEHGAEAGVSYAEPNYILHADLFPDDPYFQEQYALHNRGEDGHLDDADIDAVEAWDMVVESNIVIAVIDTGVDYTHPDLAGNIWVNSREIPENGRDDDANGFVDDCHGWDFHNNDGDPFDDHWHGTHCAGIIAARGDNGKGITGVCWKARIMPVKFLGENGSGTVADAVGAISYAVMMGARVLSNSWGGGGNSKALREAIEDAEGNGVIFVAAAGNSSRDNDFMPHYPSGYECRNIVAVAATDYCDELAWFSSYGLRSVDLAAPGHAILSTVPGEDYSYSSGTSMATPHVAGVLALVWARAPARGYREVIELVMKTVDPLPSLAGKSVTGGRLNCCRAVIPGDDLIAPAMVGDLQVGKTGISSVMIRWTATGDDGEKGRAERYQLRYAFRPVSEENWAAARKISGLPVPAVPGTYEEFLFTGAQPGARYYFALKVIDEAGNASPLSNCADGRTLKGIELFSDHAVPGDISWHASGLWHVTMHRSAGAPFSWYYGREGRWTYDTGRPTRGVLRLEMLDLRGCLEAVCFFDYFREVECHSEGYDICSFEVSADGGKSWESLWQVDSGTPSEKKWVHSSLISLSSYAGSRLELRFVFDSIDASFNRYEGWYIDDITVVADRASTGHEGMGMPAERHAVSLGVREEPVHEGQRFSPVVAVARNPRSPARVCDGYLALANEAGDIAFFAGREWRGKMVPLARNFMVTDCVITVEGAALPVTLPPGRYTWLAVLLPPKCAPRTPLEWGSNLATVSFRIGEDEALLWDPVSRVGIR